MDTTFDIILDLDNDIHDILVKNSPLIFEIIGKGKYPKTSQTIFRFITKTNFIKEGIFDLYESENIYAINILFRSLIEHYLRFQYIFFKHLMDKDDSIGDEYIKFCSLSESIDTGKAWKDVAKVIGKNPESDPFDVLKEIMPDLNKYSKEEIQKISSQFRYKNIIRFIDDRINKEKIFEKNSFLLNIIPEYSDLSSFVHGGPSADVTLMSISKENKLEKELLKKIELAFMTTAAIKQFAFLIYCQYDKRLGQGYLEITEIIKKITC